MKYDVIIIGGGPAGLTAAIYCLRRELKTLNIAKAIGGQAGLASEVQNWPGEKSIGGFELTQKMFEQAKALSAEFVSNEVSAIEKTAVGFKVKTNGDDHETAAIILAFGLTPRDLGVPGEEKFKGRGVSYCATCDGPLFKNKTVAVVGAGNSALEAAEYLSKLTAKVYLISNAAKFSGEETLVNQVKELKNIEIDVSSQAKEIIGEDKVESLTVLDKTDGSEKSIKLDGIFVEIGHTPKTDWLKGTVDLNEKGEIVTDKATLTSQEGIFAAGDCTDVGYKQMIIAAGEGAKAALSAYKYIAAKKGGVAKPDWSSHQK